MLPCSEYFCRCAVWRPQNVSPCIDLVLFYFYKSSYYNENFPKAVYGYLMPISLTGTENLLFLTVILEKIVQFQNKKKLENELIRTSNKTCYFENMQYFNIRYKILRTPFQHYSSYMLTPDRRQSRTIYHFQKNR